MRANTREQYREKYGFWSLPGRRRVRCTICGVLTYDWEKVGGSGAPANCWPCGKVARQRADWPMVEEAL